MVKLIKLTISLYFLTQSHFIDTDTIDLIVPEFTDNNNENNELEDIR